MNDSGQDLFLEMQEKTRLADKTLVAFGTRGKTLAQCEYDYRVALAKQMFIERDNGIPATIISDICRGNETVAQFKKARDEAESVYKTAGEALNLLKREIDILREQIDREWHRG